MVAISLTRRMMAGPLEAGVLGGLAALAIHNFADFNLEFQPVAMSALVGIAAVLPGKARQRSSRTHRVQVRAGLLLAGAAVVLFASLPVGRIATDEAADLDEELDSATVKTPTEPLLDEVKKLTLRHPSDYLSFGLASRVMLRRGDRRAVALINRALDLNFEHPGLHWLAAQMLSWTTDGHDQALVEYALALRTTRDARVVIADMLSHFPDAKVAARAFPSDPDLIERLCWHLAMLNRNDVALLYAQRVHKELPDNPDVAGLVADYALAIGDNALSLQAAQEAHSKSATARNSARLAKALSVLHRNDEAEKALNEAIIKVRVSGNRPDLVDLLTVLGDVQRLRGLLLPAKETLLSAENLAPDRKRRADIHRTLAKVEDALGNPTVAAFERDMAERLDPSDTITPLPSPPLVLVQEELEFAAAMADAFQRFTGFEPLFATTPIRPPTTPTPGTTTPTPGTTTPAPGTTPTPGTTTPTPGTTTPNPAPRPPGASPPATSSPAAAPIAPPAPPATSTPPAKPPQPASAPAPAPPAPH
jgi:tetratricopeptide (TPR) repeat protein